MTICRPTREDLPAVAALLAAAGLPALPHGQPLSNLLVAIEGGTVVGAIALEVIVRFGLLRSVAVDEAHRGAGLGGRLVSSMVARAHELGLRDLYLLTEDAADFFAKRGFEGIERESVPSELRASRPFREECAESARAMRLPLQTRL